MLLRRVLRKAPSKGFSRDRGEYHPLCMHPIVPLSMAIAAASYQLLSINKFGGLSLGWVGVKHLSMRFGGSFLMGEQQHISKIPRKSLDNPAKTLFICFCSVVAIHSQSEAFLVFVYAFLSQRLSLSLSLSLSILCDKQICQGQRPRAAIVCSWVAFVHIFFPHQCCMCS